MTNPGSYKGYVPGWLGHDFEDLVRDDGELRDWIREGVIPRFSTDRPAQFFLARQRLQMPPYREVLSTQETEAIAAYIDWLRNNIR